MTVVIGRHRLTQISLIGIKTHSDQRVVPSRSSQLASSHSPLQCPTWLMGCFSSTQLNRVKWTCLALRCLSSQAHCNARPQPNCHARCQARHQAGCQASMPLLSRSPCTSSCKISSRTISKLQCILKPSSSASSSRSSSSRSCSQLPSRDVPSISQCCLHSQDSPQLVCSNWGPAHLNNNSSCSSTGPWSISSSMRRGCCSSRRLLKAAPPRQHLADILSRNLPCPRQGAMGAAGLVMAHLAR